MNQYDDEAIRRYTDPMGIHIRRLHNKDRFGIPVSQRDDEDRMTKLYQEAEKRRKGKYAHSDHQG